VHKLSRVMNPVDLQEDRISAPHGVAARDPEARARSLAGIDEFLGEPLLLPDVDALLEAIG
jgi:hypothetical protein